MDPLNMNAIPIHGHVDDDRKLVIQLPATISPGPVTVFVIPRADEDEAIAWTEGVAREWIEDLADPRQDIYTMDDGEPVRED
jgi:hypothetical protein